MAEEYCRRWSELSGVRAFDTAVDMMKAVWRMADEGLVDLGDRWWGDLLDSESAGNTSWGTRGNVSKSGPTTYHVTKKRDLGKEWLLG